MMPAVDAACPHCTGPLVLASYCLADPKGRPSYSWLRTVVCCVACGR
jgi:hypothetical protein